MIPSRPYMSQWDVLIIGSGAGGWVLALLLAPKGYKIAILEKQAEPQFPTRGEILQPNGLKILHAIGMRSRLEQDTQHQWDRVHFCRAKDGKTLCTIHYKNLPPPFNTALIILPEVMHRHFMAEAERFPNIQFFQGAQFESLLEANQQVVGVRATWQQQSLDFHAKVVIGGDGVASSVRAALGIPCKTHLYSNGYLTTVIPRPRHSDNDLRFYTGKGIYFAMMPLDRERYYLMYMVPQHRQEALKVKGMPWFKETVCALHADLGALLEKPMLSSASHLSFRPAHRVRCRHWTANGCVLIGDAAHAMNPHVAQGRNAAMQDAWVLAAVLEDCFEKGDFSQAALSRYETLRRPEIEALQSLADELTWLWESPWAPVIWARERSFRTTHQDRALHDKVLGTVSGVKVAPYNLYDRWRALHLWGPLQEEA